MLNTTPKPQNRLLVETPDGALRRCRVSLREGLSYGQRLARYGRLARGPVARVQANGFTVYGLLALRYDPTGGVVTGWRFVPHHGGHPAFLPRAARRLASVILLRVAMRIGPRPTVSAMQDERKLGAFAAVLPRIRLLAGAEPIPL
jgi:hypothetical protein